MKISGHKTASVFRYDITDEADLADAAARLDEKRAGQQFDFGQNPAVIAPKPGNEQTVPLIAPLPN